MADCVASAKETIRYYQDEFFISCSPDQLKQNFSWKRLVHPSFRLYLKKVLAYLFPTMIG
jgi:hypothetical protein